MKPQARLLDKEVARRLKSIKGWKKKGKAITRQYKFSAFVPAMAFVNHVADLAEGMDHHPDILIEYSEVTLTLSTHSSGGLTALDFNLAEKIDRR
jgi:4a-hydroxytetrahydrobiopterin dehydratase